MSLGVYLTPLCYVIHSPGTKCHLYTADSFIQPRTRFYVPEAVYWTASWICPTGCPLGITKHRSKTELGIHQLLSTSCKMLLLLNLRLCKWHHQPQTLSQAKNEPNHPTIFFFPSAFIFQVLSNLFVLTVINVPRSILLVHPISDLNSFLTTKHTKVPQVCSLKHNLAKIIHKKEFCESVFSMSDYTVTAES